METYEDIDQIEQAALKDHNGGMLMMCQILREIRELRAAVEAATPEPITVDGLAEEISRQAQALLSRLNAEAQH